ncbi:MAG: hypothetical protein HY901_36525 [Deltaproteobacteria bacterium]|nr:hypothetical protein [Deltaproteobacteria bacterium]
MRPILMLLLPALCAVVPSARAETPAQAAAGSAARELAGAVAGAKPKITHLAVPAFSEVGPKATGWGKRAAELWAARLADEAKIKAFGPGKLSGLLNEKQQAGLLGAKPKESARLASVQAILAGEVMDQTDKLVVSVRLVSASTGAVLAASKQSFALNAALAAAARDAAKEEKEDKEVSKETKPAESPKPAQASSSPAVAGAAPSKGLWDEKAGASDVPSAGGVESGRIEITVRRLSDKIAGAFAAMPGNARYRRLAVLPFSELGAQAKKHQIGQIVTAEVATALRRDHGLLLVERAQMSQVMDELRIKELTADSTESVNNLGKLADAQALVLGSVADVGDKYLINARVVNAESGQTLLADSVQLPAAGMVALASDSVVLRSRSGATFRSVIVPGWGQFYNRQGWKGGLFVGAELGLLGGAAAFHLTGNWAENRYRENTAETAGHWKLASDRYEWRNILLYVAAGVWVLNIIDAYASGIDGSTALSGALGAAEPQFAPVVSAGPDGAHLGGVLRW